MTEERHPPTLHPLAGGGHVAYRFLAGTRPLTVVFLCGYASEMSGTKARFLHRVCAEAGHACLRFDYRGHGGSSGRFEDGTIGSWTDDACVVIEAATRGPAGSCRVEHGRLDHAARRTPSCPNGCGRSWASPPLPDFTEDLMRNQMSCGRSGRRSRLGV